MKSTHHRLTLILLCLALPVSNAFGQQKKRDTQPPPAEANVTPQEAAQLEAVITTSLGVIRFEFAPGKAPKHVQQFIKLARSGFYDGSAFFRVFQRSIIQGG